MNREMRVRSLAALAMLALLNTATSAQEKTSRTVAASGTATVRYKPDSARVYFGVRTTDQSFDAAKDGNSKAVKGLTDALATLKLANIQIATAPLNIVQQDSNRFGRFVGGGGAVPMIEIKPYVVTAAMTLIVKDSDAEKLRETLDKISKVLVESGANTSGNAPVNDDGFYPGRVNENGPRIVLMREDDSEFRDRAFAEAVKKAMRSAKALAEGAGFKITDTISIMDGDEVDNQNANGGIYNPYSSRASSKEVAGELELTVRVKVKCAY